MWIGDFVRCHSVVKLLRSRVPGRPIDLLTSTLCAPLLDYMPGIRKGIVADLPRGRLALRTQRALAEKLRAERYGTALVMLRTWKAALAPFLAGIPIRVGFLGEWRFGLINDLRFGEYALPRMIDRMGALAFEKREKLPTDWPLPEVVVPQAERDAWRVKHNLANVRRPIVTFAPGAVGPGKAWPVAHYAELARHLAAEGASIWVLGGPKETDLAARIVAAGGGAVTDLTGNDLRNAIIAMSVADVAVTNDSGLMHIAAAIGVPTIAIFGPTSPFLWAPLNPLAATIEPRPSGRCPACGRENCDDVRHRRTADIPASRVFEAVRRLLAGAGSTHKM
ncbi:MAG: lipopolysaccharide heptosyltransferase II [Rhizobiales bacterium]|nr:lipopolysaccharide heptosyltransferase II [Hyphomicrobiales bacterium]